MRGMGTYYDREASMKAEIKSAVTASPLSCLQMMSVIMLVLVFKINRCLRICSANWHRIRHRFQAE